MDLDPFISIGSAFLGIGSSAPAWLGAKQKAENTPENFGDSGVTIIPVDHILDIRMSKILYDVIVNMVQCETMFFVRAYLTK